MVIELFQTFNAKFSAFHQYLISYFDIIYA